MFRRLVIASFALFGALLTASPGHAGASFYVAGNGTNTICTSSTPCSNLAAAFGIAAPGDTIICVSPPLPTFLDIDKSITIDCSAAGAAFQGGGTVTASDGSTARIRINIAAGNSNDPMRMVRLRGLAIDQSSVGGTHNYDRGIDIQAAATVYIEDCTISSSLKQGIYDHRTGGHSGLFIKDSVISGNAGAGIVAASAAVSGTVLDNVTLESNGFGIAVATGNNVAIRNSVVSGNSNAGIEGDSGSQITVEGSKISHNNIGVQSQSSVRVWNNSIEFNSTAFNGPAATMGANRFSGNGSMGTPLMPISGAPADVGP